RGVAAGGRGSDGGAGGAERGSRRAVGEPDLHFLNGVPIRLIRDRWVSKYGERWAAGLSELKRSLEGAMEKVFEIYIRTTPERLWEAITNPDLRRKYNFGVGVESTWEPGCGGEGVAGEGTIGPGMRIREGEEL